MIVVGGDGGSSVLRRHIVGVLTRIALRVVTEDVALDVNIVSGLEHQYNVHSFEWPADFPKPDTKGRPLGEIYLNPDFIAEKNQDFDHLLIHGFLHLVGYDHVQEDDRMKMEMREDELLRFLE